MHLLLKQNASYLDEWELISLLDQLKQWLLQTRLLMLKCAPPIFLAKAEHGYNSPACLITNSESLANETIKEIERLLKILPTSETASASWRDYGDIVLCDTHEEMLSVANEMAYEHVQVMTDRDDWYLEHMHSMVHYS